MKKMTKYGLGFLISLAFLSIQNCSDFLEQEPGSQTSIEEQLSTRDGILQALNGVYFDLESNVRGERFAIYPDVTGGNITFTPTSTGSNEGLVSVPFPIENVYTFQDMADESDLESFYDGMYDVINQTNLILEFVDFIPDISINLKQQITAEALAVRGYCHYLLSLVYSQPFQYSSNGDHLGLVYNTTSLIEGVDFPSRQTYANTYSMIVNDMLIAIENFTGENAITVGPDYSYFNSTNTKALLARIYSSMNSWEKAFEMADEVINNSGVSLSQSQDYIAEWEQPNLPISEILLEFSIPRSDGGAVGGSMSAHFGYNSNLDYGDYVASKDLLDLFGPSDIRNNLFLEIPLPTLVGEEIVDVDYYFTKKFQDNPGYVALRLSEMYLIKAEAAFRLGLPDVSRANLNVIRERANLDPIQSNDNVEDEIFLEYRREFAFEGHLIFDIARFGKHIDRTDCIAQTCQLNFPNPRFVLPIPQDNIDINSNIEQNESY